LNVERTGQQRQDVERRVADTRLLARQLTPTHVELVGESLLADADPLPRGAKASAEGSPVGEVRGSCLPRHSLQRSGALTR
jgi:hypothetical protein